MEEWTVGREDSAVASTEMQYHLLLDATIRFTSQIVLSFSAPAFQADMFPCLCLRYAFEVIDRDKAKDEERMEFLLLTKQEISHVLLLCLSHELGTFLILHFAQMVSMSHSTIS